MRAFMVGGKPRITSAAKGLKEWRALVANAAQEQTSMWTCSPEEPVSMHLTFYMPRPKATTASEVYFRVRPSTR